MPTDKEIYIRSYCVLEQCNNVNFKFSGFLLRTKTDD